MAMAGRPMTRVRLDEVRDNTQDITVRSVGPVTTRHLWLEILDPGGTGDGIARLYELEVYRSGASEKKYNCANRGFYRINRNLTEGIRLITIQEISVEDIENFWDIHMKYLVEDGIITREEDKEFFQSSAYRDTLKGHMLRDHDKHHMVCFVRSGVRIGACQYCTYQSEDGECFIMDFWVFPEYRGNGTGHDCFHALSAYTKKDGALYYVINCAKEASHRFWLSLGFADSGTDSYGERLMIKES